MATSENDETSERTSKKLKTSDDDHKEESQKAEDLSSHARISSFNGFKLKQILSSNAESKSLFLEGTFEPGDDTAVVLLEKSKILKDSIEKLLNNADLALNLKSPSTQANVTNYACYPEITRGDVKASIICPATPKHVEKYKFQPLYIVHETPDIYKNIVLPYLESQTFSLQWVYNILEHKSESERIVFEDPDPSTGFVLLPDLKWDDSTAEKGSVYLIAIANAKGIRSLRDLGPDHLPLLTNIRDKTLDAIQKKYHIPAEKLRIFLHYQPSYYHLHVHFTSLNESMPGTNFEKAHILDSVIDNISLYPSYYQETTLTYVLKESDLLLTKLKEKNALE